MASNDVKMNHGSLQSDWTSVTSLTLFHCVQKNSVNVLVAMNVNISNELHFSNVYRSVNYIGSLAKFT